MWDTTSDICGIRVCGFGFGLRPYRAYGSEGGFEGRCPSLLILGLCPIPSTTELPSEVSMNRRCRQNESLGRMSVSYLSERLLKTILSIKIFQAVAQPPPSSTLHPQCLAGIYRIVKGEFNRPNQEQYVMEYLCDELLRI